MENCPPLLRNDFESTICADYEIAGVIHGLQSLVCSASDIPDRLDVKALINDGSHARRVGSFVDSELCTKLKMRFPNSPFHLAENFSQLSILAFVIIERTVVALGQPFRERRLRWIGVSCICPELIFGGDADTMETEFLEMVAYFGVSNHFQPEDLHCAQRQYVNMVGAAVVRENRDARVVPGGGHLRLMGRGTSGGVCLAGIKTFSL